MDRLFRFWVEVRSTCQSCRAKGVVYQSSWTWRVALATTEAAEASVQEHGARALANLTFKNEATRAQALEAGAAAEWLDGAVTAR